jgi:Right handed beta helix region
VLAFGLGFGAIACGSDAADDGSAASGRVLRVPADAATIGEAVAKAKPGDLVLVAPGIYRESVHITVDGLVLRGEERNTVILDGGDELSNGVRVEADGVAIENLTVHHYTQNGVLFNGAVEADGSVDAAAIYGTGDKMLVGYRASYVTAYDNGLYGIYAFAAREGRIEHSLVSGHPDSGLYVGQCKPCNVVIDDVIAERNAIGYYGTNASGGVFVVNSLFAHNRLGLTPNSQDMEKLAPQTETVIAANRVLDNDDPATPPIPKGFFGGGIAIGGGNKNVVTKNLVSGHDGFGIGVLGVATFPAENNEIRGNRLVSNAIDLYYAPLDLQRPSTSGNCFSGNEHTTSAPASIESLMPCPGVAGAITVTPRALPPAPPGVDYRSIPAPAAQPTMPAATTAPGVPARNVFAPVDIAALVIPSAQ